MYAVVDTGGKQAKVEKDAVIAVEKLKAEVGGKVTLPVLFLADGDKILATPEELAGVSVSAEVLEHFKGDKQTVFKLRKRKGYKRTKGHRQTLTAVRILDITIGEAPKKAAKPAKVEKPTKAETPEEPKAAKAEAREEPKPVVAEQTVAEKAPAKKAAPAKEKPAAAKPAKPKPAQETATAVAETVAKKPAKAAGKTAAAAPEAAQCEAVKSDGTRCANKAKEGSKYCGVHAKKYEG